MDIKDPIVIVSAARTPMGAFHGELAALTAPQLGAVAVAAVIERSGIDARLIDEAYIGNVPPAGLGQAPSCQAVLGAGLPTSVACTTVRKVCGAARKAPLLALVAFATGASQIG